LGAGGAFLGAFVAADGLEAPETDFAAALPLAPEDDFVAAALPAVGFAADALDAEGLFEPARDPALVDLRSAISAILFGEALDRIAS
jgi:hypothetical protein